MKTLAQIWLSIFTLTAGATLFWSEPIQTHHLNRALQFGYDAFGRNCILLTLNAAIRSFAIIIPIAFACAGSALVISLLTPHQNRTQKAIWRALLDTLSSLPGFMIAIALSIVFGNRAITVLLAAVFLVFPYLLRFYESQITQLLTQEYTHSAHALGAKRYQLYKNHIYPQLIQSTLSILPFLITRLLIIETSLTFLGINTTSHETWGRLLFQGQDYLLEAPWILTLSALPLFLSLSSFHLISKHKHP